MLLLCAAGNHASSPPIWCQISNRNPSNTNPKNPTAYVRWWTIKIPIPILLRWNSYMSCNIVLNSPCFTDQIHWNPPKWSESFFHVFSTIVRPFFSLFPPFLFKAPAPAPCVGRRTSWPLVHRPRPWRRPPLAPTACHHHLRPFWHPWGPWGRGGRGAGSRGWSKPGRNPGLILC